MSFTIAQAAKFVLSATIVSAAGAGIALGAAAVADAEPQRFTQSEDGLKMMCDRYGGTFLASGKKFGAMCSWKDGSDTICDKNENCVIVDPVKAQLDPALPMLQPEGTLHTVG